MSPSHRTALFAVPAVVVAAAAGTSVAQVVVVQAAGYAVVRIAGLGNTTTVAGDSRIPILDRNVNYDRATQQLRLQANGTRGAVRQLVIAVRNPTSGTRYPIGADGAASLRVRLDQGGEMTAENGRGYVTITSIDDRRVTGQYEGTFARGAVPTVISGQFQANFPRVRADAGAPSNAR